MHKPWEENKKDVRRQEDRDKYQDNKKKMKLKPVEKDKYRVKAYDKSGDSEEE